jgi:hypothetical protein
MAGTVQLPTNKSSGLTSFFLSVSSHSSLVFLCHNQLGAFDTVLTRSKSGGYSILAYCMIHTHKVKVTSLYMPQRASQRKLGKSLQPILRKQKGSVYDK